MTVTIAVDAMGGDHGPRVTVPASLRFVEDTPDGAIILGGPRTCAERCVGRGTLARAQIASPSARRAKLSKCTKPPAEALRAARRIRRCGVAINLVKDGTAQACVWPLFRGQHRRVDGDFALRAPRRLPGIDRPAIPPRNLPTRIGVTTYLPLDLGANVKLHTRAAFVQFAVMGSALVVRHPTASSGPPLACSTIGEEDIKGNDVVKQAGELLPRIAAELSLRQRRRRRHLQGPPRRWWSATASSGNVALKTSEGLARMLADFLREEFNPQCLTARRSRSSRCQS